MTKLSNRLNRLQPSATLAMSQKSSELKALGVDIINLSIGEPDFNTPDAVKAAAHQAIDNNYSHYSPVPGYPVLRKAIIEKLKRENGLDYTESQILCSNGAKQSVCNAIMALVDDGDEVIIPARYGRVKLAPEGKVPEEQEESPEGEITDGSDGASDEASGEAQIERKRNRIPVYLVGAVCLAVILLVLVLAVRRKKSKGDSDNK